LVGGWGVLLGGEVGVWVGGGGVVVGGVVVVVVGGAGVVVGVFVGVLVGGTGVLVGVFVGVLVGGTGVLVGVFVGVLVGGTGVLVGVFVGVLVGGAVATLYVAMPATQKFPVESVPSAWDVPGARTIRDSAASPRAGARGLDDGSGQGVSRSGGVDYPVVGPVEREGAEEDLISLRRRRGVTGVGKRRIPAAALDLIDRQGRDQSRELVGGRSGRVRSRRKIHGDRVGRRESHDAVGGADPEARVGSVADVEIQVVAVPHAVGTARKGSGRRASAGRERDDDAVAPGHAARRVDGQGVQPGR